MTPAAGCRILVVDDDQAHREMLRAVLSDLGYGVDCAADGEQALLRLAADLPSLVLLDMRMPRLDGLATLRAMRERGVMPVTIVVTAHADLDQAVLAMKLGAADYLRKPIDIESLRELVRQHCGGRDEVAANLLHRWSGRSAAPLVAVNMAALPESLIESELFGHEKGAFTGAVASRSGRVQEADGGTLFLDEIGELPLALQPKLLRAIETRRVTPVGGRGERAIDFRLVTATNRDLDAEVQAEHFRQDLYYRIAVITVEIPPLRERPEEVLPLAQGILQREGRKRLSPAAAALLQSYPWPGNVRELQNAMLRAAILAAGDTVLPENLPPQLQAARAGAAPRSDEALSLADLEQRAILAMLERTDGNRSEAARLLGISRRKLLYRLKEYREGEGMGGGPNDGGEQGS
jgi:DNA-binding NtrC family response regulator